jgi:hypothetical protein
MIEPKTAEFPAGEYYIGDLCYVMQSDWPEVCDRMIRDTSEARNRLLKLSDGRKIFFGQTAYGDGCYEDNNGNSYAVDAGIIGIISRNDIHNSDDNSPGLGNMFKFESDFTVSYDEKGVFQFGDIVIDTN